MQDGKFGDIQTVYHGETDKRNSNRIATGWEHRAMTTTSSFSRLVHVPVSPTCLHFFIFFFVLSRLYAQSFNFFLLNL